MNSKYRLMILVIALFSLLFSSYSVDVNFCQKINVSGNYVLNQSIEINQSGCFNVSVSDVVFDCDEFMINSTSYFYKGLILTNLSNVTIKNCIFDELIAINFTNSTSNYIFNNTFNNVTFEFDLDSTGNYFNTTIGNYWSDLNCLETINQSGYFRCINPANYTILWDMIDYAPQVNESIVIDSDTSLGPVINSCGLINSSGLYELNESIIATDTCINITSSDVILDCNNYSITGDNTGIGIQLIWLSNLTLQNCNIYNFSSGIYMFNTLSSTFLNLTLEDNHFGIYMNLSKDNIFKNAYLSNKNFDLLLNTTSNDNVFNNSYLENIAFISGTNNNVINSTINMMYLFSSNNIFRGNNFMNYVYVNSANNLLFENTFLNTIVLDASYNTFYLNNFTSTIINSTDWDLIAHNKFNFSYGNYWGNINCEKSENRSGYFVCLDPSSFSYQNISDIIDYAPMVSSLITPSPVANNALITTCSQLTIPGTYVVNSSLTSNVGDCLDVGIDNVAIDCYGNYVTSNFNFAIFVNNKTNVSISNCKFDTGNAITFLDAKNISVVNNSFTGTNGINIVDSDNVVIIKNFFNSTSNDVSETTSTNIYLNSTYGNYWTDFTCLNTTTSGNYFICNMPTQYNVTLSLIDYAPLSFEPIDYVPVVVEDDPFDDASREYEFKLTVDHDFSLNEVILCEVVIDDDYTRNYSFDENTLASDFTIKKYIDDELLVKCDDNVDKIRLQVEDDDNWEIYDEDYRKEDKIEYQVGDDMYKVRIEIKDYDEDEDIDCTLDLDNDEDFDYNFDDHTDDDELDFVKYFADEVDWSCDEKIDEIRFRIDEISGDEVFDENYDDNEDFLYIVGEGMHKVEIEVEDYDEDENIDCTLTIDDAQDYDYDFDEDTSDDDLLITKYFEDEFLWECDEKVDEISFRVYDELDDELFDDNKEDIKTYSYNVDEEDDDSSTDDSSTSSSSSSSSSSSTSSNTDDLNVIVELSFDKAVEKTIDFNDEELTQIDIGNSWFEKIEFKSKKSVADVDVSLKRESFDVSNKVVKADGFSYELDNDVFDVYDVLSVVNDDLTNDDIAQGSVSFKIKKDWLEDKDYSSDQVVLVYKTANGMYEEVVPEVSRTDMDYVHFDAASEGFATYAILAKKENVEVVEEAVVKEDQTSKDDSFVNKSSDIVGTPSVVEEPVEEETSLFVQVGKIILGLLLLVGFIWFIK